MRTGKLYVLELDDGFYVGSTFKDVDERINDNFTRKDGTLVSPLEARTMPEDGQWKYGSSSIKRIRRSFVARRPDMLGVYADLSLQMRQQLEEAERELAEYLERQGWKVYGGGPR